MWSTQEKSGELKGAWRWLQFDLSPWEVKESHYFGAALAAVAVGTVPENYRSVPEIQKNQMLRKQELDIGNRVNDQIETNRVLAAFNERAKNDPKMVDSLAREYLHYSRRGESVILFTPPESDL